VPFSPNWTIKNSARSFDYPCLKSPTCLLLVVEGDLLSFRDVPGREEGQPRQVGVQAVDPDVVDRQVRFARVVDEVSHVAEVGGVDGVGIVLVVEVQVEQVRLALSIWNRAPIRLK